MGEGARHRGLITLNLSYPLVIQWASQEGNVTSGMKMLTGESSVISIWIKFFLPLIRTETREERPKWKTEIFKSLVARISAGSSPGHVTNNLNGAQFSSLSLALPWSGLAFLSAIL